MTLECVAGVGVGVGVGVGAVVGAGVGADEGDDIGADVGSAAGELSEGIGGDVDDDVGDGAGGVRERHRWMIASPVHYFIVSTSKTTHIRRRQGRIGRRGRFFSDTNYQFGNNLAAVFTSWGAEYCLFLSPQEIQNNWCHFDPN